MDDSNCPMSSIVELQTTGSYLSVTVAQACGNSNSSISALSFQGMNFNVMF